MKSPAEYLELAALEEKAGHTHAAQAFRDIAQALEQDAVEIISGSLTESRFAGITMERNEWIRACDYRALSLQLAAAQQEIAELKHDLDKIYEADVEHLAENATLRRKVEMGERDAQRYKKLTRLLDDEEFPSGLHECFQLGSDATTEWLDAALADSQPTKEG